MSQIKILSLALGLLLLVCTLSGCGDKNSQADLNPATGAHSSTWLPTDHATAATNCHGSDFSGGISKVACTQCHIESAEAPHPSFWNYTSKQPNAWGKYAYALHANYVRQKGTAACANVNCHAADLGGVTGSGPSCSSCHMGGPLSAHPTNWRVQLTQPGNPPHAQVATVLPDHGAYVNTNGTSSCRNVVCHGNLGQGVFLSGPACQMCHF